MSVTDVILKAIQCQEVYMMGAFSGGLLGSAIISKIIRVLNVKSKPSLVIIDNLIIFVTATTALFIIGDMLVDLLSNVVTTFRLM